MAPRRRRSERGRPVSDSSTSDPRTKQRPAATAAGASKGKLRSAAPADEGALDGQTSRALGFVRMLVEKMQMTAEVTLAPDDGEGSEDEIRLEIEGPDAGRIIGKKGNVLEAIQYLTTRVV